MTAMMRAIEISEPGGPDVLTPTTRPVPEPMAEQILIAVNHAGVNRPDALQRAGSYAPPPGASDLPGLEAAVSSPRSGPASRDGRKGTPSPRFCPVVATRNMP
jgi:NADPH2:quinone reductase